MNIRINKRNHREYVNDDGTLIIARMSSPGRWLVTAHPADLSVEVQGWANFDEAGFGGRQWTSDIDGQQYASLAAVMREAGDTARFRSLMATALRNTH